MNFYGFFRAVPLSPPYARGHARARISRALRTCRLAPAEGRGGAKVRRRARHPSDQTTTGTTFPSKMRIFCPSNFVSSKKASSSLNPSDISCSSPIAIASPKGSDSV